MTTPRADGAPAQGRPGASSLPATSENLASRTSGLPGGTSSGTQAGRPGARSGLSAGPSPDALAGALLAALEARGWTAATAESLTGGLVCATLVDVPGASRVLRGGIVAYATDLKGSVLGVDVALLAAHGAVHPEVARQMAVGVRRVTGSDVGLATTGVAGPDPQDGFPPGTVHVAVSTPEGDRVISAVLPGGRAEVRHAAVTTVLGLAESLVRGGATAS